VLGSGRSPRSLPLGRRGRRFAPLAAVATFVAVVAGVLGLGAGAAFAHAELTGTDPEAGAAVSASPTTITLHFGEDIETALGYIRLYDADGHLVKTGSVSHPNGDATSAYVPVAKLADGAYVVAWRVVSADSHPVHGAFPFQVGTGGSAASTALINRILTGGGGDTTVGALLAVARFLAFAALAIVVGGAVFYTWLVPAAGALRSIRRLLSVSAVVGVVASLLAIGLQGPYATGASLSALGTASNWSDVLSTRSGASWAVRAGFFFVFAVLAGASAAARRRSPWRLALALTLTGLVLAATYAGHGTVGRWPVVGAMATVVHLAAMGVWLGGLAALLLVLRRGDDPPVTAGVGSAVATEPAEASDGFLRAPTLDVRTAALRFSMAAFAAVCAVAISGVISGWRQVGSLHGLTSTTYGHLLLAKLVAVALVLVGAAASRRILRRPVEGRPVALRLRRTVGAEIVTAAIVLGLTSMLVATKPALAELGQPVDTTIVQGKRFASIQIFPARQGRNTVHATIARQDGALEKPDEITIRATMPSRDVGPLTVPMHLIGANHATSDDLQLPFTGSWQLEVQARYGDTELVSWVVNFQVG
jgi:copper transport protein